MKRLAGAFFVLAIVFGAAAAPDLAALKTEAAAKFAEVRTLQADFTQTRVLKSMQNAALVFTGHLALEKGGRLAWLVEKPLPYRCILSSQELVQWDGEAVTKLSADQLPWLRVLYSSLTEWVAADLAQLQKKFELTPLDEHTLRLVPHEAFLQARTTSLELTFRADYRAIERVMIVEPSGDTLTLAFTQIQINADIPAATWRLPPK